MDRINFNTIKDSIRDKIDTFRELTFLVVGDVMLDHYIWGDAKRISPEAPVPVVDVSRESLLLGGASNVANNIRALGAGVILVGLVGNDTSGDKFSELLERNGIGNYLIRSDKRPTTVKTRVIARQQQLVRFDRELKKSLTEEEKNELMKKLKEIPNKISGIIVSDYAKGLISKEIMAILLQLSKNFVIPIFIDPKPQNIEYYRGATVITPNQPEAEMISGIEIKDPTSLFEASSIISKKYDINSVLVTRGADGMSFYKDNKVYSIPTMAKEVFDVTGAGDTSIASFSLGYVSGLDLLSTVIFSNLCAGIVVSKLGTSVVTKTDVLEALTKLDLSAIKLEEIGGNE